MPNATLTPVLTILPLENGDRLTRNEFERRYEKMPHVKKAELIERVVYISSPLRITQHGEPHARIMTWLGNYWALTSGVQVGDNCTVRLDADNEAQPDALLRIAKNGQSIISKDGYVEGAPELIVEIAASTVSIDLHDKFKVYRRNGVQEYVVWRVYDEELDWFQLKNDQYININADENGIIKSKIYPGLWLDKEALLTGNLAKVLAILQEGLNSLEYQNFLQKLKQISP